MVATTLAQRRQTKPSRRLFTLDEYERMIETGILHSGERVELIGGEIVAMAAMGGKHVTTIQRIQGRFLEHGVRFDLIRMQFPVRLPPDSEPEPDIAIVRHSSDGYEMRHPDPGDVLLVIEVSDTSLAFDRDVKIPRYAAAGIPESWLWDLPHNQLIVYREPKDGVYTNVTRLRRGSSIAPLAFPDLTIAVSEILR